MKEDISHSLTIHKNLPNTFWRSDCRKKNEEKKKEYLGLKCRIKCQLKYLNTRIEA